MEANKTPDDSDPRISFDQVTGRWIFADEKTGLEYEYDESMKDWVPLDSDEAIKTQQEIYDKEHESEVEYEKGDEKGPRREKKRKIARENSLDGPHAKQPRQSTAVYVSDLPSDVTVEEIQEVFSKYGVIAEDLITGEPKIKIYKDEETGAVKGDALVVYFKPESVPLAIEMMNDGPFRYGKTGAHNIKVEKAEFKEKSDKEGAPKKLKPETSLEKLKIQRRLKKLNGKISEWDDDDHETIIPKRWEKVVLLKHAFNLQEITEDPAALLEIKEDLMEGCEQIGPVTTVTIYDLEEEGIAMVKFKDKKHVEPCIEMMNGRYFGGNKLEASKYDGSVKYSRTQKGAEDEADEESRLDQFGNWLDKNEA